MATNNPFVLCPECISNRAKLKGVIADLYPTEKLKINIILAAFDENIAEAISMASQLDDVLANRFIKILNNDYGIGESKARWAVAFWFKYYGVTVLGKPNSFKYKTEKQQSSQNIQPENKVVEQTQNSQPSFMPGEVVNLSTIDKSEKLPKSIIEHFPKDEQMRGITDFKCSVTKDYGYGNYCNLKLTGELVASMSQYTIMMIMVYNGNNELIGADFDEELSKDFKGKKTFSIEVKVPSDEYISRISIKFAPDPVFV